MKSFMEYANEETVASDVATVTQKLGQKVHRKCKPNMSDADCKKSKTIKEGFNSPEDKLINAGIKVKTSDMDDDSYVILLYKKDDVKKAQEILEKDGYEVSVVNKLLYIS
jgi:flagellar biosynthesis GTPase FlhF